MMPKGAHNHPSPSDHLFPRRHQGRRIVQHVPTYTPKVHVELSPPAMTGAQETSNSAASTSALSSPTEPGGVRIRQLTRDIRMPGNLTPKVPQFHCEARRHRPPRASTGAQRPENFRTSIWRGCNDETYTKRVEIRLPHTCSNTSALRIEAQYTLSIYTRVYMLHKRSRRGLEKTQIMHTLHTAAASQTDVVVFRTQTVL